MGKKKDPFSYEVRCATVKAYLDGGCSYASLAKILGTCHSVVRRWCTIYKYHGYEGLNLKGCCVRHDQKFIELVLKDIRINNLSGQQAAGKYNITASAIRKWRVKYNKGDCILPKKPSVPTVKKNKINQRTKKTDNKELQEALLRIEFLEMENEALKKLKALIDQRPKKK